MNILKDLLQSSIARDVALQLCKPVSTDEIKEIMFAIGSNKASGPNGYSS